MFTSLIENYESKTFSLKAFATSKSQPNSPNESSRTLEMGLLDRLEVFFSKKDILNTLKFFNQQFDSSLPMGVFYTNTVGRLTYANIQFQKLVGKNHPLKYISWFKLAHPDDQRRIFDAWQH